jgi:hypothetical protein
MNKLMIIFIGLISHVGLDTTSSQRAVMIKVDPPHHRAILKVKTADIDTTAVPSPSQQFKTITGGPADETWFSLENESVHIDGIPAGKTTPTGKFDTFVVHLQKITTDKPGKTRHLDSKILNGDLSHPAAAAFLKYDGGTIDVISAFKMRAKFNAGSIPEQCVACQVLWTSDTISTEYVKVVADSGKWFSVRRNAIMKMTHSPKNTADSKHFAMFKSILSDVDVFDDIQETANLCRDLTVCPPPRGVTIECTDTQWP